jgi:hypothetical protein
MESVLVDGIGEEGRKRLTDCGGANSYSSIITSLIGRNVLLISPVAIADHEGDTNYFGGRFLKKPYRPLDVLRGGDGELNRKCC